MNDLFFAIKNKKGLHTAEELLKSNIDLVNKYIEELTDKYTLTHDEIMAIYNQMRPEAV